MENKDLLVSIPLTLYNELLETKFNYKRTVQTLEVVLERAMLDWSEKELDFGNSDVRSAIKQIALYQYNKRVEELNGKGEGSNE